MTLLAAVLAAGAAAAQGTWKTDIEFARPDGVSLTLDAWIPEGRGPFPAVIVVHGGGWVNGDKQTFVKPLFDPLRESGFTWFTINYRLAPKHPFPAAIEDVFSAVVWVKRHAREFKADPKRIALMGESAGGHLAAYVGARGRGKTGVAAVVDFYGPHDLGRHVQAKGLKQHLKDFLQIRSPDREGEARLAAASPVTYVHRRMPPFLFIHGTKDEQVAFEQSPLMCDRMKAVGARCEVYPVPEGPHGVGPWERNPQFQAYKVKMIEWLRATFRQERVTVSRGDPAR